MGFAGCIEDHYLRRKWQIDDICVSGWVSVFRFGSGFGVFLCEGSQARPKALDLRSSYEGIQGFESLPSHFCGKNVVFSVQGLMAE